MIRVRPLARRPLTLALPLALIACAMTGCGDGKGKGGSPSEMLSAEVAAAQPLPTNASPEAKLLAAYLVLQERLALDDMAGAKAAFGKLLQAASAMSSEHAAKIKTAATDGAAASDIAAQRKAFDPASEAAIALVQASGNPLPNPVYLAHCPMAFEDRGARWLQRSDKIANPYYGASMLTCGSIDATIAPGRKS